MLWVSANPSCGKSVLAKCLVDELKTIETRTTCYFFFKDDFEDQRSAKVALSCILHQLLVQRESLFSAKIMDRFKSYKTTLANSYYELWELWGILVMVSQEKNAGEIIYILDAFDECETQEWQDFAKIVREFYVGNGSAKPSVNLKFLITSRPYDKIRRDLIPFNFEEFSVIHLKGDGDVEAEQIAGEIGLYIKDRLSHVRTNLGLTQKEEELLFQGLGAVLNQTYLWVYLTLEWIENEICNKICEAEIRKAISILPRTVDEAYEKILAESTDVEETKKMLHIVVAAKRLFTLAEMDLALAIQPHHNSQREIDQRPSDRFRKYIRDLCGLFINIKDEKIYLLHQTAKEFLVPRSHQDSQERIIAQGNCLRYLFFAKFETCPLTGRHQIADYSRKHVFLEYSAKNCAAHFHASNIGEAELLLPLFEICDPYTTRFQTWFTVYWEDMHTNLRFPSGFTTLMVASYLGIESVVRLELLSPYVNINAVDYCHGRSELSWASESGFEDIVKLLLKDPRFSIRKALIKTLCLSFSRGTKVNTRDSTKRTPLAYASLNGHLSIIRMLIKAGARANMQDDIGATPISYSLCIGRQDIANELTKGTETRPVAEIRDELLLSAVTANHESIVKRLLDTGADTETVGKDNKTPLVIAIEHGHMDVAQLLINRGAAIAPEKGLYRCYRSNGYGMGDKAVIDGVVNPRALCIGEKFNSQF
ncbi:ankyrin repeat-containing domain protein [Trichoderma austrokoningii]